MKVYYLLIKLLIVFFIIVLLNVSTGCRDPHDFEPQFDSLVSPPDAPLLLLPPDDTIIWCHMGHPLPFDIELHWASVANAQYYEIDISTDPTFPDARDRVSDTLYIFKVQYIGKYYWRVRAYNRSWTWYTSWSEVWNFTTKYSP
jgi:hypothetical protein